MGKDIKFKVTLENGEVIEKTAKSLDDLAIAQKQAQAALSKTDISTKEYKTLAKELKDVEKAQEKATMRAQGLVASLANIEGPIGLVGKGFQGLSKAGTAFAANPVGATITAIGVVLGVLTKALGNTEKGMQAMNKITAMFGEIIDPIIGLVEDIAAALAEGLAFALEKVGQAMSFFGIEAGAAAQAAEELSVAEMKLEQENQKAAVTRAKTNKDLAETREILSDSNATYEQRVEALKKVQKAESEQSALEIKNAKESLRIATDKYNMHDDDLELRKQMRDAEIALAGVEQDAAAKGRLLNKQQTALDKEAAAQAEARAKEAAAKAKERSDAALALKKDALKAEQKAVDEAYLLSIKDEELRAQEALKITQRDQDAEVQIKIDGLEKIKKRTKLENEALAALKAQQAAQDVAQQKALDELLAKQQAEKLKAKKEAEAKALDDFDKLTQEEYNDTVKLTDEYYKKLNTALIDSNKTAKELKDAQFELDMQRLEQEKLNAQDYGKSVVDIEEEIAQKKREKREEDAAEDAALRDEKIANAQAILGATVAILDAISSVREVKDQNELNAIDRKYQAQIDAAEGDKDAIAAIEEEKLKESNKIKKQQFDNNKKLQYATAVINGAVAVGSIIAQYPKFDGGIAMVAALVVAGVALAAQLIKIKQTEFVPDAGGGGGGGGGSAKPIPSMFAEGGLVSGPGTGVSDSIPARLSNGESVINANSTAMFGGLLSMINEAGGGKRFAEGGVGGSMDAPILKTYVVASEVTSQQEADFQIQQIARL
jgi:hypothetical protein